MAKTHYNIFFNSIYLCYFATRIHYSIGTVITEKFLEKKVFGNKILNFGKSLVGEKSF